MSKRAFLRTLIADTICDTFISIYLRVEFLGREEIERESRD